MVTKTGWRFGGGLETGLMALLAVYGNQDMMEAWWGAGNRANGPPGCVW